MYNTRLVKNAVANRITHSRISGAVHPFLKSTTVSRLMSDEYWSFCCIATKVIPQFEKKKAISFTSMLFSFLFRSRLKSKKSEFYIGE